MMAGRKVKIDSPTTGEPVEATVVDVDDIKNRPIIINLSDGTLLNFRVDIVDAARIDGEWDSDGNPIYAIRSGTITTLIEVPDNLKKGD